MEVLTFFSKSYSKSKLSLLTLKLSRDCWRCATASRLKPSCPKFPHLKIVKIILPSETGVQKCSVKKVFLEISKKITGKHLCQSLSFKKIAGLRSATLLRKRPWHRCFPVNFVKFLRTPFFIEHLWWLLLYHDLTNFWWLFDVKISTYLIGSGVEIVLGVELICNRNLKQWII